MALITTIGIEEGKLDHVTVVAMSLIRKVEMTVSLTETLIK
jgi:hypothetical protein